MDGYGGAIGDEGENDSCRNILKDAMCDCIDVNFENRSLLLLSLASGNGKRFPPRTADG
jgi:hypothetical protein